MSNFWTDFWIELGPLPAAGSTRARISTKFPEKNMRTKAQHRKILTQYLLSDGTEVLGAPSLSKILKEKYDLQIKSAHVSAYYVKLCIKVREVTRIKFWDGTIEIRPKTLYI